MLARPLKGQERSFANEVRQLTLGAGEIFHGEAILAVTKALLQSGISYVGGYPGAPMSHLLDVLADASDEILEPHGIQFEQSASEAGAAALLSASINYPLRGAVTWKSVVGTNVASDALSNLASVGVIGGALIILGEDYGEGASIIQERSLAAAVKSSIPLLDPRNHIPSIVKLTEQAFELSEASHMPVMMSLRIRACHMTGGFTTKDNLVARYNTRNPVGEAEHDVNRIALPPANYVHEKAKFADRIPAARKFITDNRLNEVLPGGGGPIGIITQGGAYDTLMRGLRLLGQADGFGKTEIPILVLNVIHPLVPVEIENFLADKQSVLVIEEGNPNLMETAIAAIAQRAGIGCRVRGKDFLPMAGEYVADIVRGGVAAFLAAEGDDAVKSSSQARASEIARAAETALGHLHGALPEPMPPRPPSFCTGCPERPVLAALKLIQAERGPLHVSLDIGCSTLGALPPFSVGNSVMGYGLSLASAGAAAPNLGQPIVALMGDGGFWHNGLATGLINAQWNSYDAVLIIVDNGYASATGQQHLPSTGSTPRGTAARISIEDVLKGIGVAWIKHVDSYDLTGTLETLREALDARGPALRVVISNNECMIALQRRKRPAIARLARRGAPHEVEKFGVDPEICVGDHSCMGLSGCPSLTLKPSADPLKETPIAHVDEGCVACGHCGSVAQAAGLCPSFYKAEGLLNRGPLRRLLARLSQSLLAMIGAS